MKKLLLFILVLWASHSLVMAQTVQDVNSSFFYQEDSNLSITTIACTLSDGTETTCYSITTNNVAADHEMGPWCPDNISDGADAGGIWLEDGIVHDVDGAFIANLAEFYNDDTWLMYDDNGDIYITETEDDCTNAANPNVGEEYQNFCVECLPAYITDLSQTWIIPITPVLQDTPTSYNTAGGGAADGGDAADGGGGPPNGGGGGPPDGGGGGPPDGGGQDDGTDNSIPSTRGIALNGIEYSAPAPVDAILSAYTIAPFDDAGGHINVNQGYHYHAATGMSHAIAQADGHAALIGYAMDGNGIYAQLDESGNEPTDLDECRGHSDDVRGYHYHIDAPGNNNFINCLLGAYVVESGEAAAAVDNDNDGFDSDVDCNDNDAAINPDATEIDDNTIDENCDGILGGDSGSLIDASFFNNSALVSVKTVDCTLENGSETTCYELVFTSNPVENGPYCPSTIDEIGGLGIYDGDTNPGFQVLKKELWDAMEADGYDIVDEDGNVTVVNPGSGMGGGGGSSSACLEAAADDDLLLTFLIPVTPELLSTPDVMQSVENIGISIDGIPLTGDPPSVTISGNMPGGGGAIPSLDPCGGHMDPSGYYHLHFVPEEMNSVLDAHGITEVSCTNFVQSETALVGFAKDGFPIYASKDADGVLPSDLDGCHGHTAPTADFPDGVYHYHASSSLAPNVPPCLVGSSVRSSFSFESSDNTDTGDTDTGDTGTGDTDTGDTGTGDTDTGDTGTGDTDNCDGCTSDQRVGAPEGSCDETLSISNEFEMTISGTNRTISSNSIPKHMIGVNGPNAVSAQSETYNITTEPQIATTLTPLLANGPQYSFGVLLNGVELDPVAAEPFPHEGIMSASVNWEWNLDALGTPLGLDCNSAHVQPTGKYHYHGLPTLYIESLNVSTNEMTLVGYAADGFPIYHQYAYTTASDASSSIIEMSSSYRLKEGCRPGDGVTAPCGEYNGVYSADYEYVEGLGTLDEANGRTGLTPEFPDGTYYYVLTDEFPAIPRYFKGTPSTDFTVGPGGGGAGDGGAGDGGAGGGGAGDGGAGGGGAGGGGAGDGGAGDGEDTECTNNGGDADNDGICSEEDCDDNDANVGAKQTAGTACNDGDATTENDVIQADGCNCAGTTIATTDCVAPTDPVVTGSGGRRVRLSWSAPPNAINYTIQIRFKGQERWLVTAVVKSNIVSIYAPLRDYEYHIKSNCADGESEYGTIQEFSIPTLGLTGEIASSRNKEEIEEILIQEPANLYPNPVKNNLNLFYPTVSDNTNFVVYNSIGKEVFRQQMVANTDNYSFFINHLEAGIYFGVVQENGEVSYTKQFVRQ